MWHMWKTSWCSEPSPAARERYRKWQRVDPWPNRVPASEEPSSYHNSITNPSHLWGQLSLQHLVIFNRTFSFFPFSSWFQCQFLSTKMESLGGPAWRWQGRRSGLQTPCNTWGATWLWMNPLCSRTQSTLCQQKGGHVTDVSNSEDCHHPRRRCVYITIIHVRNVRNSIVRNNNLFGNTFLNV